MNSGDAPGIEYRLGQFAAGVDQELARREREAFSTRVWAKDPTLWAPAGTPEITNRLGWLTLPESMPGRLHELQALAESARSENVEHIVVMGMGGSSLSPEVFARTFGSAPGYPKFLLLDSTHPTAVRDTRKLVDPAKTWWIVSSKSGTTLETLSLFRYFWKVAEGLESRRGDHFLAVTDPGTPLEALGKKRKFRRVVLAQPEVGGRFSALTPFGLLPAAFLGFDLAALLSQAQRMAQACGPGVAASENPGLVFGTILGELGHRGVDKVTLLTSSSFGTFPVWAEQLIAESTGKTGRGLVPIAQEPVRAADFYGRDRCFVYIHVAGDEEPSEALYAAEQSGRPFVRLEAVDRFSLGAEFFRWEFAVACAGPLLGIHPFDQPDVEFAKQLAREAMADRGKGHAGGPTAKPDDRKALHAWRAGVQEPMYVAIQAYLAPSSTFDADLAKLRELLGDLLRVPVTVGYGPRYLHSTGQLQKGGPPTDVCLQLIDHPREAVAVPETQYSFGRLVRAEADGDASALEQRGRRLLRIDLGANGPRGLETLIATVEDVLRPSAS